jgi:glycosyltransferase involved in cell wall biosynthesis
MVVGFTYMVDEARGKFYSMLEQDPGLEITILVPRRWRHPLYPLTPDPSHHPRLHIVPARTLGDGREGAHVYGAALWRIARQTRPDVIHVDHGPAALSTLESLIVRRALAPKAAFLFFTWVNWWYNYGFPRGAVERAVLRGADGAVAGNTDALGILRRKAFAGPIWTMPQRGVDPERYAPGRSDVLRARLHLDEAVVVGFLGRLAPEKGLRTLVAAFKQLEGSDARLLIVGDGPERDGVAGLARHLGVADRVSLVGAVPIPEVLRYLQCMDILVLPSESHGGWREQFGHVLIEAMSCAIPVIGSTCGEIPHVIGDGGLVFPEGDAGSLADCLRTLAHAESQRVAVGGRGRARVLEHFSEAELGRRLAEAYRTLVARRRM